MVTQYFDTLKSIGESDRTNTLFLSHSPGDGERGFGSDPGIDAGGGAVEGLVSLARSFLTQNTCAAEPRAFTPAQVSGHGRTLFQHLLCPLPCFRVATF